MRKRRRDGQEDLPTAVRRQVESSATTVDEQYWRQLFLTWAVTDNISMAKTSSKRLRKLLGYRAPLTKQLIPKSRNTTRSWIVQSYIEFKPVVIAQLAKAQSRISLSFDAWKSDSEFDTLGVVAHFIDYDFKIKNVLIALRNTYGSHQATELRHLLITVIREYQITTRIAFFMADSASNNDLALHHLKADIPLEPSKQRLRCVCHIINLVCKAILYGVDVDCVDDESSKLGQFEKVLHSKDEMEKLLAWRKKGPIGKLHNLVIHACRSTARRNFFKSKQKEAYPETERLYQLVVNGGIRWNSTCDILERAFKLKDALELYQHHYKNDEDEPCNEDLLTSDDWIELASLLQLLKPLKEVSLTLQSDGKDCNHGSLWESLTAMDFLMTRLEELKQHLFLAESHFKACINLGWTKLNKYYTLSDSTPAYRAAIVVHPSKKMRWFEVKWSKEHPDWIPIAREAVTSLYNEYKLRHADEVLTTGAPTAAELSEFERYNMLEDDYDMDDDLERYLREERAPASTNPLQWWQANHHRYPVLRHMAFDLLATPASSTADERAFSKAGQTVNLERYNTKDDLAEANQCLKSWIDEGLIYNSSKKDRQSNSSSSDD